MFENVMRKFFLISAACLILAGSPAFPVTPLADVSVDLAFSPRGASLELILAAIRSAEKSILTAAYTLTSKPVATALSDARQRGITVRVVADKKGNSGRYTAVTFLASQGVPVRLNRKYAIHHHKFMVIDGRHVQTGSFNYSAAASGKNAENVLVLWNAPELAARYAAEWQILWEEGEALETK
jgi:phosphatidylserine/phosphatidylglycerophosphate/cardiolipin synthase-like enzyme